MSQPLSPRPLAWLVALALALLSGASLALLAPPNSAQAQTGTVAQRYIDLDSDESRTEDVGETHTESAFVYDYVFDETPNPLTPVPGLVLR